MSTAQDNKQEHTDTINIPTWIATVIAIGTSIRSGSVGLDSSDINEFIAIFSLSFIALTKIAIALHRDRFRIHGMIMLWVGSGILLTIVLGRIISQQELISATDNRIFLGWAYFAWVIVLVLLVNRFRIKRWLIGKEHYASDN